MKFSSKLFFSEFLFLISILFLISAGCKKTETDYDNKSNLSFSADTIAFDTVFTTIGSSTEYFMIYNNSDKPILISKVYLAEGSSSNFRINIDGLSGFSLTDIEILPNDSLFAFVEVTVDPNGGNTPLLITDSIVFETNGIIQDIDLVAYGQDAFFIIANINIQGLPPYKIVAGEGVDTTWDNTKPIVIYGYAVVDSAAILRISKGTKIYFHKNSGLWSYIGGTLYVNGTKDEPVVFQGDRLDNYYKDVAGQWDRIWLNESPNQHQINYAIIKNGFIGIQSEPLGSNSWNCNLKLENSIIQNMSGAGLLSRTAIITSANLIVSSCQQYAIALTMGGLYSFTHATIGNYWSNTVRKSSSVYVNNYYKDGNNIIYPFDLLGADFTNCIIYGNLENEFLVDSVSNADFNFNVFNCFVKTNINTNTSQWVSIYKNIDPQFVDYQVYDFHPKVTSPVFTTGKPTSVLFDIEGENRSSTTPTPGAYENEPSI